MGRCPAARDLDGAARGLTVCTIRGSSGSTGSSTEKCDAEPCLATVALGGLVVGAGVRWAWWSCSAAAADRTARRKGLQAPKYEVADDTPPRCQGRPGGRVAVASRMTPHRATGSAPAGEGQMPAAGGARLPPADSLPQPPPIPSDQLDTLTVPQGTPEELMEFIRSPRRRWRSRCRWRRAPPRRRRCSRSWRPCWRPVTSSGGPGR